MQPAILQGGTSESPYTIIQEEEACTALLQNEIPSRIFARLCHPLS